MLSKKIVVFIYIDALRRDLLVANIIKNRLEVQNFKVFLVSRDNYKKILKFVTPNLYIIIKNFLKNFENELHDVLKKTHTIVIDAEGAMSEERCQWHLNNLGLDLDKILPFIKKSFVWNESFKKFIKKNISGDENKIMVVGSPKINISFLANSTKIKNKKKSIGFVGRFGCINSFDRTPALQTTLIRLFENDVYKSGAIGELKVLEVYIDIIKKILAETDFNINVRPHPNENLQSWFEIKKLDRRINISKNSEDFLEWMNKQDFIITTPSTSVVEPLIQKIPIISIHKICNESGLHQYYEETLKPFIDNLVAPNDINELMNMIKSENIKPKNLNQDTLNALFEFYNYSLESGKNAIDDIVNYINTEKFDKTNYINFLFVSAIYYSVNFFTFLRRNKISKDYDFNYFNHRHMDQFAKKILK